MDKTKKFIIICIVVDVYATEVAKVITQHKVSWPTQVDSRRTSNKDYALTEKKKKQTSDKCTMVYICSSFKVWISFITLHFYKIANFHIYRFLYPGCLLRQLEGPTVCRGRFRDVTYVVYPVTVPKSCMA